MPPDVSELSVPDDPATERLPADPPGYVGVTQPVQGITHMHHFRDGDSALGYGLH
jgi:hypothetical protein